MTLLVTIKYTNRFGGSYTVLELCEGRKEPHFAGDYKTERTAKGQISQRMNFRSRYPHLEQMKMVTPEEMDMEIIRRRAN